MTLRTTRSRIASIALIAACAVVGLSACTGGSNDDSGAASESAGGGGDVAPADSPTRAGIPESGQAIDSGGSAGNGSDSIIPGGGVSPVVLQDAAIIKTGAIELESDDVGQAITKIKGLVLTSGGRISSEDTATNASGEEFRSRIELQVPVGKFDAVYDEIPTYGTHADRKQSSKDVTGELADVNSRVRSAQDSIDQLRELFSRATKLGHVITLERELSERQADLEALEAQQRSLNAQTTMSTILVSITEPQPVATTKTKDDDQAGFVSGIKKGWDGMVTFVVGTAHAVGLVLPIASLLLVVALSVWLIVRRFTPRRDAPVQPQPSE
jgi:hypothetical protein